ncbi:Glutamate-cysteine ligase [Wickerhamomyces ciferrii]|uniref:Glutamate--cysteine ligase n=1 Tax=Wickerhamomyces ciferrii (strain ATCC 14091 / BCRC 22168 / CBS 111 / JCM 3599 / NBRC 0793 / NRRL Y-1031 F-60-10) TaxID=1206466 RepID=K0KAU3_WICCF|nr:Glutamate-cysteine ligase [Wickerhamomyces ciferrii]CCH42120.1 Glutamate-cysteine ligase [Wickerhamomyces ciferrii]
MGLLSLGTPLPWEESRQYSNHIRSNGLEQLINMFNAASKRQDDPFLWGDELEYILVQFNNNTHRAKINIDKDYILEDLNKPGHCEYDLALRNNTNFHPEYGRFMIEATPIKPYNGESLNDYLFVEENMTKRRIIASKAINNPDIIPLTITSYPLMGIGNFTEPPSQPNGDASKSLFLPDEIINRHVRFPTLTANIRKRRGEKVAINIPMYQDETTAKFDESIPLNRGLFSEDEEPILGAALAGHIYMDSMGFGMGCSCLQVTVQAPNVNKARYLYDSWANLAPIFLALSSATPILKGHLADQDVRWNVISKSVDDRTAYERDVEPLRPGNEFGGVKLEDQGKVQKIPKSRYDSIDSYLGDKLDDDDTYRFFNNELNDNNQPLNELVLKKLISNKDKHFDLPLAQHFAHLYIRDPLVIFNERINQDNLSDTDHFENIQSTNWQTIRFKPPTQKAIPTNHDTPGWRVEFRSMDIQITDFENAAFATFIALLGHSFLLNSEEWNFYIPISKIEENMSRAHFKNPIFSTKYFFKKDIHSPGFEIDELSINEIINGSSQFIGLIKIVENHLKTQYNIEISSNGPYSRFYYYLKLISGRASGELISPANYIRYFVLGHETYQKDSKITEEINFELLEKLNRISKYDDSQGELSEFFGNELSLYLVENKVNSEV